jgi:hypothetical protein
MNTSNNDGFIMLPTASGDGALLRRSQVAGARANGHEGSIVYLAAGPSVYTSAAIAQIARYLEAEVPEIRRD